MVAILTLFVGLVAGIQTVELAVSAPVVQVELRLDGEVVGRAMGEPWVARCDLGSGLHPSELVAVGLDAHGREVARDRVYLNLPDRRAEVVLVPELDEERRLTAVTVRWSSPELGEPRDIDATVDDTPVRVDRDGRLSLRSFLDGEVHVLTVEVSFTAGVHLRQELVFGAGHAGEVAYELTAIPVRWQREEPLTAEALEGVFSPSGGGDALEVAAVERGPARVVVVRDQAVEAPLEKLLEERKKAGRRTRRDRDRERCPDALPEDVAVRVMAPVSMRPPGADRASLLFPISDDLEAHRRGLLRLVTGARYSLRAFGLRRLSDAVALAGMRAAAGNHRRAVVVVLGPEGEDASRHRPEVVRRYLDDLRVPLRVWDVSGAGIEAGSAWGEVEPATTWEQFVTRVGELARDLEGQHVVWLRGRHLPQEVELSRGVEGLELAR